MLHSLYDPIVTSIKVAGDIGQPGMLGALTVAPTQRRPRQKEQGQNPARPQTTPPTPADLDRPVNMLRWDRKEILEKNVIILHRIFEILLIIILSLALAKRIEVHGGTLQFASFYCA